MSVQTAPSTTLSRRRRAAATVAAALRGGLIGTVVAAVAWVLAGALAGTAFVVLLIATIGAVAYLAFRGNVKTWIWLGLAVAWAVVLLEREIVQENGGVWVALAGWLGVIVAARRAGISRWAAAARLSAALGGDRRARGRGLGRAVGLLVALGPRRPRPRGRGAHAAQAGRAAASSP